MDQEQKKNQVHLNRSITLPFITLYGIGTIIGAGIYVLTGKVAQISGFYAPLAFIISALIAAFTGLSYAELSSRYPLSAGEAVYVLKGLRSKRLSTLIGWLVVATGVVSAATISIGFVGYFKLFVPLPDYQVIIGIVSLMFIIAAIGVNISIGIASIITLMEIGGLLYIIFLTGDSLLTLPEQWEKLTPPLQSADMSIIFLGAFLAFYAFIGFEDMVNMAEEVKKPEKTLPKAIILSLLISGLLYFIISLISVLAIPLDVLTQSEAPLADLVAQKGNLAVGLIGIIGMIAVTNGALVQIIMGSRVLYGMGNQGVGPKLLAKVNPWTKTPLLATFIISLTILVLALFFPIVTLAKCTTFIILFVFAMVNLSLICIKSRDKNPHQGISFPLIIPLIGLLFSGMLMGLQLYQWV